ncbi:MAG: ParB/RepB/Spo0J family partition protein, partial [Ignavibacteriaceae bacterium]|nr:ParB/RepB/Spo0J family partition protein [Ignavibacteriaceae bacterium]
MSKFKPGLGRGLEALITPESINENSNDSELKSDILIKIKIDLISANPFQPRTNFDRDALEELKNSILANGLIQPITVRRNGSDRYEIISGERRFRAFTEIGFTEIPAYVIEVLSDEQMLAMALIENIQREKLNPIEEALAFKRLMDECSLTQEQIAERVSKNRTTVANTIRLLKLPEAVQQSLIREEISSGHARALINIQDESKILEILQEIKFGNLNVRKVEELAKSKTKKGQLKTKIQPQKNNDVLINFQDKLRGILGTKVQCFQKNDGTGEIKIDFYSNDDFERLID